MLIAALVVVLGLLWTLTSLAPNSERINEPKLAQPNTSLSASIEGVYDGELPPPPPPPFVTSY